MASHQVLQEPEQRQIHAALNAIETHLNHKISSLFSFLIRKEEKERLSQAIKEIQAAKQTLKNSLIPQSEAEARLKFYAELSKKLNVKNAATNDLEGIKVISSKFWKKLQNYEQYESYMKMFFEGEHFLFEEDDQAPNDHYQLYDKLRDRSTTAYIRGSSHYDHGTTNGKAGGPSPTQLEIEKGVVENPQYEIAGPQIKALLFGRVKLAVNANEKPIFGKTFEQACKTAKANGECIPTKFRKCTFIQAEWWPDNSSIFTLNFWGHRLVATGLYRMRQALGFIKPNVGPYGYGHADKGKDENSNPTIFK